MNVFLKFLCAIFLCYFELTATIPLPDEGQFINKGKEYVYPFKEQPLFMNSEAAQFMDELAIRFDSGNSSGKSSKIHNYVEVYASYFHHRRNIPIRLLEIGIHKGHSVQLWENYFPRADLYFMDIRFDDIEYFSNRSHYYLADQSNVDDLARVIRESGGCFDVIIDDGGHFMSQQITSFIHLFPHLNPGGIYIIEDLHTSYWQGHGVEGCGTTNDPKAGPDTCIEFLKKLIDDVNYMGAKGYGASHAAIPNDIKTSMNLYQTEIYSISFYDSLCVITKRLQQEK